jgi:hypothetical protein
MRKFFCFSLCVLFWASGLFAQGDNPGFNSLKRIEAKTSVGTTYQVFLDDLGNAKYEIDRLLSDKETKISPEQDNLFKKVLFHYEFAASCWREKNSRKFGIIYKSQLRSLSPDAPPGGKFLIEEINRNKMRENAMVDEILSLYPEVNKPKKEGGSITNRDGPSLDLGLVIQAIFLRASQDLLGLRKALDL